MTAPIFAIAVALAFLATPADVQIARVLRLWRMAG
jgi:hypothetical protein